MMAEVFEAEGKTKTTKNDRYHYQSHNECQTQY